MTGSDRKERLEIQFKNIGVRQIAGILNGRMQFADCSEKGRSFHQRRGNAGMMMGMILFRNHILHIGDPQSFEQGFQ